MMATIGYKAQLYGSMTKLKFEISYTQYQIKGKKKLMGIAIFDAMQNGDHKGAEVREQGKLFGQTISMPVIQRECLVPTARHKSWSYVSKAPWQRTAEDRKEGGF